MHGMPYLPVFDGFDTFGDYTAVIFLHVFIHFRKVVHQVCFRATMRHGGEFERGFVRHRVHQLKTSGPDHGKKYKKADAYKNKAEVMSSQNKAEVTSSQKQSGSDVTQTNATK